MKLSTAYELGRKNGALAAQQADTNDVITNSEWITASLGIIPPTPEHEAAWIAGCRAGYRWATQMQKDQRQYEKTIRIPR